MAARYGALVHEPFDNCPMPCRFELTLRLFGDQRAHRSAARVQVSLRDDEAGDQVGAKSCQRDGDRPTHAVTEHGAAVQGELIQELGDGVRMVLERVAELLGSVAIAVTEEVDQERAVTDQGWVRGDRCEVR